MNVYVSSIHSFFLKFIVCKNENTIFLKQYLNFTLTKGRVAGAHLVAPRVTAMHAARSRRRPRRPLSAAIGVEHGRHVQLTIALHNEPDASANAGANRRAEDHAAHRRANNDRQVVAALFNLPLGRGQARFPLSRQPNAFLPSRSLYVQWLAPHTLCDALTPYRFLL